MDNLPNEMIFYIYSFLDLESKLYFSIINHGYYYLLNPSLFNLKKSDIFNDTIQKYNNLIKSDNLPIFSSTIPEQFKVKKLLKKTKCKITIQESRCGFSTFKLYNKNRFQYQLKIYYNYPGSFKTVNNNIRKNNVDTMMEMFRRLQFLTIDKKFPHLQLPLSFGFVNQATFFTKANHVPEKHKSWYQNMVDSISDPELNPYLLMVIEKQFHHSLLYFINHNTITFKMWKIIIFQVLYILAKIQTVYPSFRYNILSPKFIDIIKIPENYKSRKLYIIYKINGRIFKVPNIGYYIVLSNFIFASIEGVVENNYYLFDMMKEYEKYNSKDRYFDMYTFLDSIRKSYVPKQVIDFIDRIIGFSYDAKPKTTPYRIITRDPFFKEFRYGNKLCHQCSQKHKNGQCVVHKV